VTADLSLEGDGWNVFVAGVWDHEKFKIPASGGFPGSSTSGDNWGIMGQGGIFVAPKWELFARWDYVHPNSKFDSQSLNVATVGANCYLMQDSHAAKFTVDFLWFFDKTGSNFNTLTGILPSDHKNQYSVRAQMQLVF
jgi:hypothetical protein